MRTPLLILLVAGSACMVPAFAWASANDMIYPPQPAAASAINFDGRGFIINGQRTFIASGSIHYPRVPRALWFDRLLRLKRAGLNCVQTYAFPNYHTSEPGVYDFSGEKDFNQFLQDAHDLGLYATVRPGIYACAEWDNGGYPEWLLLEPGMSVRTTNAQFLAASDEWYDHFLPIVASNQINDGGSVILVQLDNENPNLWGMDTNVPPSPYFHHLLTNALANGIEVPMFFSGLHHGSDPAGTSPWDSAGRESPWYTTEYWAGWFTEYGYSAGKTQMRDHSTWKIIAYGGNGYNYYMFHGGSDFGYWNNSEVAASYDYGAAVGQAGDLRTLYYRDKRAALFARTFQAILEDSTNATAAYSSAASGVTGITARGSPAGTIIFLDNTSSGTVTATLTNGAQIQVESYEIVPIVKDFALANWLTIQEADARILGAEPQGNLTTLVLYGLPGETVRVQFRLTSGSVTHGDTAFATNASDPANVTFSSPVVDGPASVYELSSGTNILRVLVASKATVDRTWFVDSGGANYIVSGPAYVGVFTNAGGEIKCTLEEPLGSMLPMKVAVYGPDRYAPHFLTVTNQIYSGTPSAPALVDWQMRSGSGPAAADYDDATWFTTNTAPLMGADGDDSAYAWYRSDLIVSNAGNYFLTLPTIRDYGMIFVNGLKVGDQSGSSAVPLSVALHAGTNSLAVFTTHYGRNKLAGLVGTGFTAYFKGLVGSASLATTSVTNWYWHNIGRSAPSASSIAQVTATNFDPAANGWSTGTNWSSNVFGSSAGYAWFRTVLPPGGGSHSIQFANVDDNCTVYLNGTNIVGTHTGWGVPFVVSLDPYWQTGSSNYVTVLVQNTGGGGGINGAVSVNPQTDAMPYWKLRGGLGTIDGTNVTWQPLAASTGLPTFYRAQFQYQPPPGVLSILRAGFAGLSHGFMWLNRHNLGRYPEKIPIAGIYLPECWLQPTNTLVIFDEQGNSPTNVALWVETAASRQIMQVEDLNGAVVYPPASVLATAGDAQIALSWTAVPGATGYNVKRANTSGGPYALVATNYNGLSFTNLGLANGVTYFYVVPAVDGGNETPDSLEASATPLFTPPSLVNSGFELPGTGKISTDFATVPGWTNAGSVYADSGVESTTSHGGSYHAYCGAGDGGAYQMLNYHIQPGDVFTLTWWATTSGGSGASSQMISLISAPTTATPYSSTSTLLSTNNSLGTATYSYVQYALTYTAKPSDAGKYIGVYFNNQAPAPNWMAVDDVYLAILSQASAPAGLTATAGDGQVTLNWTVANNATGYNVKRSMNSGGAYALVATNLAALTCTDSGLSNGMRYYYVVSGTNSIGESPNSAEVAARPTSFTVPALSSTLSAGDQLQFRWPGDHTGWTLQAQTNAPGTGLGTNWLPVNNSWNTNEMSIPVSATSGSVFFRLVSP